MKYFLDTEFLEGTQKKRFFGIQSKKLLEYTILLVMVLITVYVLCPISYWFILPCALLYAFFINLLEKVNFNTKNTIDLISIGIVSEDSREYYAVSKDFNLKEAWNRFQMKTVNGDINPIKVRRKGVTVPIPYSEKEYWIRENVLLPIFKDFLKLEAKSLIVQVRIMGYASLLDQDFTYKNFKKLLKKYGKTNEEIAKDIKNHIENWEYNALYTIHPNSFPKKDIEFYAYYADYDWVVFCWLFGKMINLPEGFPKYCIDLKQILDEKAKNIVRPLCFGDNKKEIKEMVNRSIKGQLESLKTFPNYPNPKKYGEHNALGDAKWGLDFYKFLQTL